MPATVSNLDSHWPEILDTVRQRVGHQTFQTWYRPLAPLAGDAGGLQVSCPNHFFLDWFSEHQLHHLNDAGTAYFGHEVLFELVVSNEVVKLGVPGPEAAPAPETVVSRPAATTVPVETIVMPERPQTNLNPDYVFSNFVVGSGTDLAYAAATAISDNPGHHFNPLFIHGGVGLGKTHLMQAIGNRIAIQRPQARILYTTAENFMNDLVKSIQESHTPDFKLRYRSVDVLLVDDVAFMAGKESTQEEFFHTFNALYNFKKQIVFTSDRSPKEITRLEERLRSRFEWGLITDIQPPNLETRIAILRRKVDINNIYIADDVIEFIAEHITDNIRRLEGALVRLLAFASLTGREITLEMASEALSSFFQGTSTGPVKIADVMEVTADVHGFSVDQLKSKRRTQDLARARQIAMHLARELTGASLNKIGRSFGNRDHSTVAYACKKISDEMETDPRFRGAVRDLMERIRKRS
ncbi:MAG: chromosomal replication initiator protein DnaA [bacterium]|nr:chromosomal replication initiator protein DnaA [bacterium]